MATDATPAPFNRNGRPVTALTRRKIEALALLVRHGLSPSAAAGTIGVADATLSNWRRYGRGENPNSPLYGELEDALEAAEAERRFELVELADRARRHAAGPSVRRARGPLL